MLIHVNNLQHNEQETKGTPTLLSKSYSPYFIFGIVDVGNPDGFWPKQRSLSDSEYALCKAKLERAHQGFYRLSYGEQYVRDVIMPDIRNERVKVAPHFPHRVVGTDSDILLRTGWKTTGTSTRMPTCCT